MSKISVSVVVPNYNNEKYINKCIESILEQTYPLNEIIVYDDASTDGSRDILEDIERRYDSVKVIYGKENKGVSFARDTAIKSAESEYITMIDADDFYYDKDKILNEVSSVRDNSCVFSQVVPVCENGEEITESRHLSLGKNVRFRMVTRLFGAQCPRDFLFSKKSYIEIGGYRSDMNLFEDWELSLRFLEKNAFVYSNGYGTAYRQKDGGLSKVNPRKQLLAKKMAFELNASKLRYSISERITFYSLLYFNYFRALIRSKR